MKKSLSLLLLLIFSSYLFGSDYLSKLNAYSKSLLNLVSQPKQSEAILKAKTIGYPFKIQGNDIYISCLVEVDSKDEDFGDGVKVLAISGDIYALQIPYSRLSEVLSKPYVKRASFGRKYRLLLDSARSSTRANYAHQGINLPRAFTGKGVIIGIFDSGIDLLHPDFRDENGSRVLYLWDMTEDVFPKPPEGFDWGREYTKEEIDNNLENVLQKDKNGHGTHVAGIAGGNGSSKNEYKGFAPEANFIIVSGERQNGSTFYVDEGIIAACSYIFQKADALGRPCVINLSLGSILSSHDGEDLLSKALSNLVSEKKGRAIVASAGNEGDLLIHSGGDLQQGKRYEILLYPFNLCDYFPEMCPDIPNYFLFGSDIWTSSGVIDSIYVGIYSRIDLSLQGEKGFSATDVFDNVQIFDENDNLVGLVSISNEFLPNSDNFLILISNEGVEDMPIENYLWSIVLKTKKDGRFDSWSSIPIGSQNPPMSRYPRFPSDNAMTINSPADGKKIISVGAYVSKNKFTNIMGELNDWSDIYSLGEVADFSSRGPSRDGRTLPIITAPGMIVFSALSGDTDPENLDSTTIEASGTYIGMAGTSMSAPCVAGAIALLFEQNPNLYIDETIELLKLSARKDVFTGNIPNNDYGWGKLDVLRLLQLVTEVKEQIDTKQIAIYPNPTSENFFVLLYEPVVEVEVFDVLGNLLVKANNSTVSIANLPNGMYFVRVKSSNRLIRDIIFKN